MNINHLVNARAWPLVYMIEISHPKGLTKGASGIFDCLSACLKRVPLSIKLHMCGGSISTLYLPSFARFNLVQFACAITLTFSCCYWLLKLLKVKIGRDKGMEYQKLNENRRLRFMVLRERWLCSKSQTIFHFTLNLYHMHTYFYCISFFHNQCYMH